MSHLHHSSQVWEPFFVQIIHSNVSEYVSNTTGRLSRDEVFLPGLERGLWCKHEDLSSIPNTYRSQAWPCFFVVSELGMQRQEEPTSSDPSDKACVRKQSWWILRNDTRGWPLAGIHRDTHSHRHSCTYTRERERELRLLLLLCGWRACTIKQIPFQLVISWEDTLWSHEEDKEEMTSKVAESSPWLPGHFLEWVLLKKTGPLALR